MTGDDAKIETPTATIWIEDGVLYVVYVDGIELDLEKARALLEAESDLLAGRKLPSLVDMAGACSITREARILFAGPEAAALQSATALVVGSPLTRMLGNMFLGLNKTLSPTKLFRSKDNALEWLEQFK